MHPIPVLTKSFFCRPFPLFIVPILLNGTYSTPSGQYCSISSSNLLIFSFAKYCFSILIAYICIGDFLYEWLRRSSNLI